MSDATQSLAEAIGELSHSEMLVLTGLTRDRLLTWYKRDVLPDRFTLAPGSGNARRYHWHDVMVLAAARELADAGIPLIDSVALSIRTFAKVLSDSDYGELSDIEVGRYEYRDTSHGGPEYALAVIFKRTEKWKPPENVFVSPGGFFSTTMDEDEDTVSTFGKLLRKLGAHFFIVFDMEAAITSILVGLNRVMKARKSKAASKRRK